MPRVTLGEDAANREVFVIQDVQVRLDSQGVWLLSVSLEQVASILWDDQAQVYKEA